MTEKNTWWDTMHMRTLSVSLEAAKLLDYLFFGIFFTTYTIHNALNSFKKCKILGNDLELGKNIYKI